MKLLKDEADVFRPYASPFFGVLFVWMFSHYFHL
ncbi:uncharacterized protein METZ01_LOCUS341027, partial [marine metagenome]